MTGAAAALLTYSAQVLILVGVAALAALAIRLPLPAARLHYWRAVVVLCLLLPVVPDLRSSGPVAIVAFEAAPGAAAAMAPRATSWAASAGSVLPWVVAAGILARLLWLGLGVMRLRQLRRRSRPAGLTADLAELHQAISPSAVVRATADLTQPVTFGWRRPIVLLPPHFATLTGEARRAVLCHELLHVRRRDWPGIVCEELLRAVFWFHPAMWWALEQVHLSREQVVDQLVMAHTPARRAYMDALLQFADAPDAARPAIAFLRRRHLASRLRQLSKEPHMTRLRLVSALLVLLLVVAGTAATVLSALPLTLPALGFQGGSSLEVRLAETQPAPGLVETVVPSSNQRIYLRPGAVVTGADVTSARVADTGGVYSINVTFSAAASNRLAEATKIHLGRPVAILLDGRVLAAPTLRSIIRGSAVITGDFTRGEAERIAAGLTPRGAAAAPDRRPFTGQDAGVVLPALLTEVKPQYTAAAMQARIQGDVELELVVRADGTVDSVTITKSLDPVHGLDNAAIEAAELWTFKPGTKDGRPADVLLHLNMRFTLK
ncbi:MAG TPA: TonB family protein [Vicinamibacterales bacterium]|nr:TonB family protein [Vicinamibacterales bacterium]